MLQFQFVSDLEAQLREQFPGKAPEDWRILPERTPENMPGELTVNTFRFARVFGQAPDKIAAAAAEFLARHPDIETVDTVKAFVNVTVKPAALFRDTVADGAKLLAAVKLPETQRRKTYQAVEFQVWFNQMLTAVEAGEHGFYRVEYTAG